MLWLQLSCFLCHMWLRISSHGLAYEKLWVLCFHFCFFPSQHSLFLFKYLNSHLEYQSILFASKTLTVPAPRCPSSLRITFKTLKNNLRLTNLPQWLSNLLFFHSNPHVLLHTSRPCSSQDILITHPPEELCTYHGFFSEYSPLHNHMTYFLTQRTSLFRCLHLMECHIKNSS